MSKQKRWLCADCHREWRPPMPDDMVMGEPARWTPEAGCPCCKSLAISLVEYEPPFRGGDIPRPDAPAPQLATPDVQKLDIRRIQQPEPSLALSSPEFG
jgi:hypothetical protein